MITIVNSPSDRLTNSKDIPAGMTFAGRIGTTAARLFYKVDEFTIVALDQKAKWEANPVIIDYRPVDIEIKIL